MKIFDYLNVLLSEIGALYNKATLTLLHRRMGAYHQHVNYSASSYVKDIKLPLLKCIDNVVIKQKDNKTKALPHDVGSPVLGLGHTHKLVENHTDIKNPYILDKKHIGELSKYFKERKKGHGLQPAIKDKLRQSVWGHINASIRCARRGDKLNAQMHADIANNAFKEISHYMPEKQYLELSAKVKERLNELEPV